jgi:hypothetical protein
MPIGRVPATLRRNRRTTTETFTRLGIVEDRVRSIDGVFGCAVPAFRCPPVFLERCPGRIHRSAGSCLDMHGLTSRAGVRETHALYLFCGCPLASVTTMLQMPTASHQGNSLVDHRFSFGHRPRARPLVNSAAPFYDVEPQRDLSSSRCVGRSSPGSPRATGGG